MRCRTPARTCARFFASAQAVHSRVDQRLHDYNRPFHAPVSALVVVSATRVCARRNGGRQRYHACVWLPSCVHVATRTAGHVHAAK
eukprot:4559089-Pleurochrysis_carterae.AAC.2